MRPDSYTWLLSYKTIVHCNCSLCCNLQIMILHIITLSILTAIFPGEPGLASFIEAKDDVSSCDKSPVKLLPQTNQRPIFYRLDSPSCRPTLVSEHWREKYHIRRTCSPQAYQQLCLWPLNDNNIWQMHTCCVLWSGGPSIWMAPWKNRTSRYISFSAHHSIVFYFRCSVYWWKGRVRF